MVKPTYWPMHFIVCYRSFKHWENVCNGVPKHAKWQNLRILCASFSLEFAVIIIINSHILLVAGTCFCNTGFYTLLESPMGNHFVEQRTVLEMFVLNCSYQPAQVSPQKFRAGHPWHAYRYPATRPHAAASLCTMYKGRHTDWTPAKGTSIPVSLSKFWPCAKSSKWLVPGGLCRGRQVYALSQNFRYLPHQRTNRGIKTQNS